MTSSVNLLKTVNESLLSTLKDKLIGQKAEPVKSPDPIDIGSSVLNDASSIIFSNLTSPDAGEKRCVLYMTSNTLSEYRQPTAAVHLIDKISDEEIADIFKCIKASSSVHPSTDRTVMDIKIFDGAPSLQDQINGTTKTMQIAVLLDVPSQLSSVLLSATDLTKQKQALKQLMSPKLYEMALFIKSAKAIAAKFDSDPSIENFNPNNIAQYPRKDILSDAKKDWDRIYSPEAKAAAEEEAANKNIHKETIALQKKTELAKAAAELATAETKKSTAEVDAIDNVIQSTIEGSVSMTPASLTRLKQLALKTKIKKSIILSKLQLIKDKYDSKKAADLITFINADTSGWIE